MRVLVILGAASFSTLLLVACSATQDVALIPTPGQETILRNGLPTLVSKKKHLVMLKPNAVAVKSSSRPSFTLVVRNLGAMAENLLEQNISANLNVGGGKTANLPVLRYAQLVTEEQNRQNARVVVAALSGVGQVVSAASAGNSTTTGSFSTSGPRGSSTYGTYSASTYDAGAAYAAQAHAQAQSAENFAVLQAQGEQNLAALERTILKDHTVMPGEWFGGSIVLEVPSGQAPDLWSIQSM